MNKLSYDLHIHSCLSPCGSDDMTPFNIASMAYLKGLDVIALTDHNTCRNCPSLISAAKEYNLTVICGMELTTVEEVHVVCLFYSLDSALEFDRYVYEKLIKIINNPEIFGNQIIYDEHDRISSGEDNLLINATTISFDEVFNIVKNYGGISYPAHIDRTSNSVISNLGFIPPESSFNTVEFADITKVNEYKKLHPYINNCKILTSSDAHYLENINEPVNFMECNSSSIKDILDILK